jgi:CubicO group peptidase (beta-lactamase class C family)
VTAMTAVSAPPLQATLNATVAAGAPGVIGLVLKPNGFQECIVLNHPDNRNPVRRDSLFRIASMTKPIASVAALMLEQDGLLALTDPVTKWLPEFSSMMVLEDPARRDSPTRPADQPITILDLLTHRSGLTYAYDFEGPLADELAQLCAGLHLPFDGDEWLSQLASLPLVAEPNTKFQYGLSTDVLGILIGRAVGGACEDFLTERIFQPLVMKDTHFLVSANKQDRLTDSYEQKPDGTIIVVDRAADSKWSHPDKFRGCGGGLVSSVDDYLSFARFLFTGMAADGRVLLPTDALARMRQDQLTQAQRRQPAFGQPFFAGQGFGLGVAVVDNEAQQQEVLGFGRNGSIWWDGAYGTSWLATPSDGRISLFFTQFRAHKALQSKLAVSFHDAAFRL